MPAAPLPSNESERLATLNSYGILDTLPEQEYDDLVGIASRICGTPIALVSIVDENRQWFKARIGVDVDQTDRDAAFCAHAILNQNEILTVSDATQDNRFVDNPLVTGEPHIRFYAGSPLVTSEGLALGTLCVIDSIPRELTSVQRESLEALGRQVTALLELRRRTKHLEFYRKELERSNRELQEFAYVASHDLKEPIRGITHLANFLVDDHGDQLNAAANEKISCIIRLTDRMQNLINRLLHYAKIGGNIQRHESVDMHAAVRHACESLVGQIDEQHATIECGDLPSIRGDRLLIEELIQNLISNAIKYNDHQEKRIKIGFAKVNDPVSGTSLTSFYVADNGIGIPENLRSDVFRIFRRLHGPDDYGGGSGVGLTIVRKIIQTHDGNLWIDDGYNNGTCFWFSFCPVDESQQKLFRC